MKKKKQRVPKDVELTSVTASFFDSEMNYDDEVGITELAKSIFLSNNSHPHVDTMESLARKIKIWQDIAPYLKFVENKKGKISRIRKVEPTDMTFKREIREDLKIIKNQLDKLMNENKEIKTKIGVIQKEQ